MKRNPPKTKEKTHKTPKKKKKTFFIVFGSGAGAESLKFLCSPRSGTFELSYS